MKRYIGHRKERLRQQLKQIAIILAVALIILTPFAINKLDADNAKAAKAWQAQRQEPAITLAVTTEPVIKTPKPTPKPSPTSAPAPSPRLELTDAEKDKIVRVVWHEARGEPPEGQQAVIEVIFNRVEADNFPDTVDEVIDQPGQFSSAPYLDIAEPGQAQYDALDAALYGEPILPKDVVYFSRAAENDRVWGAIGNHVFCYQYVWG